MPKTYRVIWEMDIDADSPIEAAAKAKWYQLHGDWSSVFDVNWPQGGKMIDLDECLDPEELAQLLVASDPETLVLYLKMRSAPRERTRRFLRRS